jgi:hypothetical protein
MPSLRSNAIPSSGCVRASLERGLLVFCRMTSQPKKPAPPPAPSPPPEGDFAQEAGPKDTEFKDKKDAKAITSMAFELIP